MIRKRRKSFRLHGIKPDSFCEWSVKNRMEELSQESVAESMRFWYERAVDEQNAELRQYRKKLKAQEAKVEPVPLTVEALEEELTQVQGDKSDPIKV